MLLYYGINNKKEEDRRKKDKPYEEIEAHGIP